MLKMTMWPNYQGKEAMHAPASIVRERKYLSPGTEGEEAVVLVRVSDDGQGNQI
jgi:hypothetical protein